MRPDPWDLARVERVIASLVDAADADDWSDLLAQVDGIPDHFLRQVTAALAVSLSVAREEDEPEQDDPTPTTGTQGPGSPRWTDGRPIVPGDRVEWTTTGLTFDVDVIGISDIVVPIRIRGTNGRRYVPPETLRRVEETDP